MALPAMPPLPGLFAPPILRSTIDRLASHLNPLPPSSSGLEEPLQTLHRALLRVTETIPAKTQCSHDLMSQLRDVAYAADDLVDELEYRALQQRVEEMAEASANQKTAGLNLSVFKGFQTGENDAVNQPVIPSQPSGESSVTTSGGGSSLPVSDGAGTGGEGEENQTTGATGKQGSNRRRSRSSLTLCSCFHDTDGLTDSKVGASSNPIQTPEHTERRPRRGSSLTLFKPLRSVSSLIIKWRRKEVGQHQVGDDAMDKKTGSPATLRDDPSFAQNNANLQADGVAMNEASGSSDSTHKDDEGTTDEVTDYNLPEISYEKVIAKRIEKIVEQLDRISSQLEDALNIPRMDNDLRELPEKLNSCRITSTTKQGEVYGRDGEREQLVRMLLDSGDGEKNVPVIAIFGAGGVGKTTLAQYVYSDKRIEKYFHSRGWICASDDINVMRIAGVILGHPRHPLTNRVDEISQFEKLDFLEEILEKELEGKRFLLVLDDVQSIEWTRRFAAIKSGQKGSKIVITARREEVVHKEVKRNKIVLEGLNGDDFWLFFKKCAFGDEDPDKHLELQRIGKEIAEKLKGLPLVAKVVGGLLQVNLDGGHWTNILRSELWELARDPYDIMPSLRLSYQCLPSHLQWCFAYCSAFPRGYPFDVDKLVNIWIAQGLVQSKDMNKRLEDVGGEYVNDLLSRSYLEIPNYTKSYWRRRYHVMHDLLHELAVSVCLDECLINEGKDLGIMPMTIRHLSLSHWAELNCFSEWESLRTLIVNSMHRIDFGGLRSIRVLDLSYSYMRQLPDAVSHLIHLRYLDLSGNSIYSLPESLCRLYHLQTLIVPDICHRLPKGVTNLINLRHLSASDEAVSWIAGIGKLTCLQELKEFHVRIVRGHDIGQLKNMRELRGELCIQSLEDVGSKEEAIEANLKDKIHIEKLQLKWSRWIRKKIRPDAQEILEWLQPPPVLKVLELHWFRGARSPSWLAAQCLQSLQSIYLKGCERWRRLPPLGQLPVLEVLRMESMDVVVDGGDSVIEIFPSLKELWLVGMSVLFEGISFEDQGRKFFHHLQKLKALNCSKVKGLPPLSMLSSLEELEVKMCPDLESELPECLKALTSLSSLKMSAPKLTYFPGEVMQYLKHLEVDCCPSLSSWSVEEHDEAGTSSLISLSMVETPLPTGPVLMRYLTSLRELKIDNVPKLTSFTTEQKKWFKNLTSLQELCISNCKSLIALPMELHELPSLEKLAITYCPKIRALPIGLPTSLKKLDIWGCNPALVVQWQGERAPDWVNCIPYKSIY
ncbi:putative disease resistance protein RGA4 [Elaeis guineensis]|uniref:putative disease resistance protein RGA4 n=1 Tax=Elaeis guineensis var. tenera TaxID=51953 RepID=UPI003C6D3DC2